MSFSFSQTMFMPWLFPLLYPSNQTWNYVSLFILLSVSTPWNLLFFHLYIFFPFPSKMTFPLLHSRDLAALTNTHICLRYLQIYFVISAIINALLPFLYFLLQCTPIIRRYSDPSEQRTPSPASFAIRYILFISSTSPANSRSSSPFNFKMQMTFLVLCHNKRLFFFFCHNPSPCSLHHN